MGGERETNLGWEDVGGARGADGDGGPDGCARLGHARGHEAVGADVLGAWDGRGATEQAAVAGAAKPQDRVFVTAPGKRK